jgi:HEAT repeat protein
MWKTRLIAMVCCLGVIGCGRDPADQSAPKSPQESRSRPAKQADRKGRPPDARARALHPLPAAGDRSAWARRYDRLPMEDTARDYADPRSVAQLVSAYQAATSSQGRVEIIEALAGRADSAARRLLGEAARTGAAEERIAALEALAEGASPGELGAVAAALDDGRAEVRAAGVWLLGAIPAEDSLTSWKRALGDRDAEVTELAFDRLRAAPMVTQVDAAIEAAQSAEPWRAERAIALLGSLPSRKAVEALIGLVDHPESGDLARDGLFFLVGEFFGSGAEASKWYEANRAGLEEALDSLE